MRVYVSSLTRCFYCVILRLKIYFNRPRQYSQLHRMVYKGEGWVYLATKVSMYTLYTVIEQNEKIKHNPYENKLPGLQVQIH